MEQPEQEWEYVVVGSGPGGGTVAARLAEAGHTVLLLEAGGDARQLSGGDASYPAVNRLPDDYDVPCFHPFASENEALAWNYFVRHYGDDERQRQDPNYRQEHDGAVVEGVLYPRAGTLGGCSAHNAMIFLYPQEADWDGIAALTGDRSWRAGRMRRHFQRLENCRHRPVERWLAKLGWNPSRHGFGGWLPSEAALPMVELDNRALFETLLESVAAGLEELPDGGDRARWLMTSLLDPNDARRVRQNAFGWQYLPLTTDHHARHGTRERLLEVAARHPQRLQIEMHALATRVVLDGSGRATGVEYLQGERLYRAHARPAAEAGVRRVARARREVILAAGAFNTPQLLMLSGIGPAAELARWGIETRVDLPGVGQNLQDRYEVGIVHRMHFREWHLFEQARFAAGDPQYAAWRDHRAGPYMTNGGVLALTQRSAPERPLPDLILTAFLGRFQGYFPGYSRLFVENLNYLTWAVLKAHTNNRAGEVTLRSPDARDPPRINFRYFEEGSDHGGEDLESVVAAIRLVRTLTAGLKKKGLIAAEELPGEAVASDDQLRDFVRTHAWGHHASCTCAIGPRASGGVLDSGFRVHGTRGLRVVDASVFPRIPGLYIACAVYMIGEKAAATLLADARRR